MHGDGEDLDEDPADLGAPCENAPADDDPLPEYTHYRDEGCGLSNSCLNCPFPRCVYEVRGGMRRYEKDKSAREIIFQYGRGFSAKQIARMLDENLRTVQRVIKEFKRDTDIDTENGRETWDE
ncbi:helix-turn-helix domain-containing protein [Dehalogenimonas etheniformans]|uniref:Helix-turn-helix domain-containing protein n=1 Tax=Dehalogenimonas etheniformans TaxID=1536648 RepID=A0A2P5P6V5_9CHLR|nr:helix-turn-helix domain-containing protein [Dehalogenimonas etheniformans]PPD58015.1 helix-turn-helix domain-containing protein [Dehalogenimonas etheniformans]QNT75365.1 helix-turn-helix domain-containing protein [Dehalogenimonas etheniformans]